jgi:hypothetical protein
MQQIDSNGNVVLPNVKKLIHQAEVTKRVDSVTERKSVPVERRRERTINLNINNYKISFR